MASISNLPSAVRNGLASLEPHQQDDFAEEYNRRKKSAGFAYVLWFFLGWHYAYLGKWGVQFLYWISVGGLLVWAFIDLFRLAGVVKGKNQDIAFEVLKDVRAVS